MRNEQLAFDGVDNVETIGLKLRSARLNHGLSLQDVSKKLNISVHYLSKLEAGQFDSLPASVYVTGFLRSYAKFLDLDAESLVATYNGLSGRVALPNFHKMPMTVRPPQRSAPAIASIVVVLLGIAYGAWYLMNDYGFTDQGDNKIVVGVLPSSNPPLLQSLDDSKTQDLEMAGGDFEPPLENARVLLETQLTQAQELASVPIQGVKRFALPKPHPNRITADKDLAQRVASVLPEEVESPTVSEPGNLSPQTNAAIATLRDPAKEIIISAVASSWVEIIRSDGETVITKLMRAGDRYVVDSGDQFYLSTGNAGGLVVVVGGDQPRSMGKIGEIIRDMPLVSDKLRQML